MSFVELAARFPVSGRRIGENWPEYTVTHTNTFSGEQQLIELKGDCQGKK
jgi:hypothetical protein